MNTSHVLLVRRRTGSVADVLEAIGTAYLVQHLGGVAEEAVSIAQTNDGFEIRVQGAKGAVRSLAPLIPYFKDKPEDTTQPLRGEVYDYAGDKKKRDESKTLDSSVPSTRTVAGGGKKGTSRKQALATEEREDRGQISPRWPNYNALQSLTKGSFKGQWNEVWSVLDGINDTDEPTFRAGLWSALNDRAANPAPGDLARSATLAQHFNPIAAKGTNRGKADSVKRDNLKHGSRFSEWLKMIAFDRAAVMRRAGDTIRLWLPTPAAINLAALHAVRRKFEASPWRQGDVKQDIAISIDVADALARHFLQAGDVPRGRANQVIRGLETATFQDMGGGYVVMNVTAFGLPAWIVLRDFPALHTYLEALDSFRRASWSLDEDHSDDIGILVALRDAIGAETPEPLLAFFAQYSMFVQRQLARKDDKPYRFNMNVLDAVLGGIDEMLNEIVKAEGFRRVAAAIRKATVSEQWKKREGKQVYEIHYGLFAELRRSSRRSRDLVARLSEFVASFNAESARVAEAHREQGWPRARVSESDLDEVVRLIDTHGPELVGSLLCAYGSATGSRDDDAASSGAATAGT